MKRQHIDEMAVELRDARMTALLRDAYADDPALIPAPGRTERIMRRVMSAGVQPARRPFAWWGAFGWSAGALAAAGLLLVIGLGITTRGLQESTTRMAEQTAPAPVVQPVSPDRTPPVPQPRPVMDTVTPSPVEVVDRTPERVVTTVRTPERQMTHVPRTPQRDVTPPKAPRVPAVQPDVVVVAGVAPESLYVEGKYHEAAEAWFARYQQAGNPDDLVANAVALAMAPLPAGG